MSHIVYPVNLRFPMERANSIQIIQTCHALARAGDRVTLIVRGGPGRNAAAGEVESLAYYGLNPHRNLQIVRRADWRATIDRTPANCSAPMTASRAPGQANTNRGSKARPDMP